MCVHSLSVELGWWALVLDSGSPHAGRAEREVCL